MAVQRCPGQDRRFWRNEDIFEAPCPHCGGVIEFWKDDPRRTCGHCGQKAPNPRMDLGCAQWCKFAKDCLGVEVMPVSNVSLRDSLVHEMQEVFGGDERRIAHAMKVLDYAERILVEEGGDPLVVTAAAILHDIGILEAERKHGSAAGAHQETEGPPIAREILERLGVQGDRTEHICAIIANHHSAKDIDTPEFRIIWDADQLVNAEESGAPRSAEEMKNFIRRTFRTTTGKTLAFIHLPGGDSHAPASA